MKLSQRDSVWQSSPSWVRELWGCQDHKQQALYELGVRRDAPPCELSRVRLQTEGKAGPGHYHPSSGVFRRIHRLPSVPPTETSEELLACFPGQCACMGSHEEGSGCFICCFLQKQRKMFVCSPKWSKEVLGETVSPLLCIDVRNVPANLIFGLHLRFTLPLVGSPTSKPASVMHTPLLCCWSLSCHAWNCWQPVLCWWP